MIPLYQHMAQYLVFCIPSLYPEPPATQRSLCDDQSALLSDFAQGRELFPHLQGRSVRESVPALA